MGGHADDAGLKPRPPCSQSCGRLASWMVTWGPPDMKTARLAMCSQCARQFRKEGTVRALKPREY